MSILASHPLKPGLAPAELLVRLAGRVGAISDDRDSSGRTAVVARERLRDALAWLRDEVDLRFDVLLDIAGVDYLAFPGHRGPRFAAVYLLKSTVFRHRIALKVAVEEEDACIPSAHDLFKIAGWQEREVWDLYGITFDGHPNLRRLLNHHEFVGHPLRKDYPCQKRQKLSVSDPMVDQLEQRLRQLGYQVVERGDVKPGDPLTFREASA